jgi:two-component system response regulator DevR
VRIRVAIVGDHPVFTRGLAASLSAREGLELVGAAKTLAEARALLASTPCDVVLLDLRLPDGSGVELLREAGGEGPSFVVLSSFMTPEYVSAAIAMGASGFLLKTAEAEEIDAAVTTAASGALAFSGEQLREARRAAWQPLTATERAILAGVRAGRSNDELTGDLSLSKKTVEGYITRLLARFGLATRTELAVKTERDLLLNLPTAERRRGSDHVRP